MMPNNVDPSAVGASMGPGDPLSTMYTARLANEQSSTANAPNLYGGQAQPSYSDLGQGSASTGYTQGATQGESLYGAGGAAAGAVSSGGQSASSTSANYGEQGGRYALTEEEGQTQQLFSLVYEQVGEDVNQGRPQ